MPVPETITPSVGVNLAAKYPPRQGTPEIDRSERQAAMKADLAALLAANPLVGKISIVGYTPYFSDGDLCTHSQYSSVDDVEWSGLHGRWLWADDGVDDEGERTCPYYVGGRCWNDEIEIDDDHGEQITAVDTIIGGMAPHLADAFGTNWTILVKRDGDNIVCLVGEYTDHD